MRSEVLPFVTFTISIVQIEPIYPEIEFHRSVPTLMLSALDLNFSPMNWTIIIISGGQTGADRAALDFAIKHEIPHGGWCPNGRKALDGPLEEKYKLKETPSEEYLERTEWNVRDSDATVVFTLSDIPTGGSKKTINLAKKHKKPCLHLHRGVLAVPDKLIAFLDKHQPVRRLNVAGSRESKEPGLYEWVTTVLERTKVSLGER